MSLETNLPSKVQHTVRILLRIQKIILFLCSMLLAISFFLVVVLRYIFEADLFAYEEWVLAISFWLYFIGGAQGSYEGTHIKADFVNAWVGSIRVKWLIANTALLLEIAVGIVLSYWAYLMVMEDATKYPDWPATVAWKIPFLLPRLGIFLGLVLMTFYTALHFWVAIKLGPSHEWDAEEAATGVSEGV
ncbi:TRAP transporter small permease [Roseibium sp. SCP14]|uniref:TRAP transporter small permease n=1 Tax=Roseibium sp. SCP14 TaxID=3141375 RepID=UPI0033350EBA